MFEIEKKGLRGILVMTLVVLALVHGVYAAGTGPTTLKGLENEIPLLKNQFYVATLAKWLVYADVAVLVISLGMMLVGQAGGGDRVEAAGLYAKGKKMFFLALILLPVLAALPTLVKFLLNVGTTGGSSLAGDVPEWG